MRPWGCCKEKIGDKGRQPRHGDDGVNRLALPALWQGLMLTIADLEYGQRRKIIEDCQLPIEDRKSKIKIIILLTDFGQSEYVGVMKGVIYSIDHRAQIVDLCHSVSSQNIIEALWILKNSYKYFPKGSVFCCVVDPGVGSQRRALAVKTTHYYFVAPDNGLLWESLKEQEVIDIREIPIPSDASHTFHGRDVFAPAAAKISLGKFDELGEKVGQIERLELYQDSGRGLVVRIDSFGNIITNIPKQGKGRYSVKIGEKIYQMDYRDNYSAAKQGELFLIEGSNRTLEISLKNGSAHDTLHLKTGTPIEISCER